MFNAFAARSATKERHIGDYLLLNSIGKGCFAEVRLAQHLLTRAQVVVKIIKKQGISRYFQEVDCLKRLSHPNIIKLFEVISTEDKFFLVMERVSRGDLLEHLEKHGPMTEGDARTVFRQVVSAVEYCHHKRIIHRDLKPDNILLDHGMTVKLAGFGFSKEMGGDPRSTFCGTVCYSAPEILLRLPHDGRKADVWSLGVVLYRMLTGVVPFEQDNVVKAKKQITSGHYVFPCFLSGEVQNLLTKLLTVDPTQRPTLEAVMKDPWLNQGQAMLRPYIRPPWGDIDPQVTEMMKSLGFKKEDVQESVTQRKFDRRMGTYLILRMMKTKMPGRTIRVRPFLSSDTSSLSLIKEGYETEEEPSIPPNCLRLRVTTSPSDLETMSTTTPEHSTDTPRADHQLGSAGSPSTQSRRGSSRGGGGPEEAAHESRLQTGQPEGGSAASPPQQTQGQKSRARRAFQFFLRFTCCGPSTEKKPLKRSKTKPA